MNGMDPSALFIIFYFLMIQNLHFNRDVNSSRCVVVVKIHFGRVVSDVLTYWMPPGSDCTRSSSISSIRDIFFRKE